ncbi:MAG TPA: SDR family NAD(P)-dependent oxidoreductase, partial [Tepidisphaeraceae bacterium]
MSSIHKPINEQVMLITGASSGIGLRTAEVAAEQGAKVILLARNEEALARAVANIRQAGGQATYEVVDVADAEAFRQAAEAGAAKFGPIDTWVNNAGVGMYTRITDTD